MSSSLKSIKYECQHCISSTNGSISINSSIFWGGTIQKKPWGQYVNLVRFQKKLDFPFFWPKAKILQPGKLKFQHDLKRVCPITSCAICIPDMGVRIFVLFRASSRVVAYNVAKVQNISCIASSLKVLWYGSMEWNMEENFSVEWNVQ